MGVVPFRRCASVCNDLDPYSIPRYILTKNIPLHCGVVPFRRCVSSSAATACRAPVSFDSPVKIYLQAALRIFTLSHVAIFLWKGSYILSVHTSAVWGFKKIPSQMDIAPWRLQVDGIGRDGSPGRMRYKRHLAVLKMIISIQGWSQGWNTFRVQSWKCAVETLN